MQPFRSSSSSLTPLKSFSDFQSLRLTGEGYNRGGDGSQNTGRQMHWQSNLILCFSLRGDFIKQSSGEQRGKDAEIRMPAASGV